MEQKKVGGAGEAGRKRGKLVGGAGGISQDVIAHTCVMH